MAGQENFFWNVDAEPFQPGGQGGPYVDLPQGHMAGPQGPGGYFTPPPLQQFHGLPSTVTIPLTWYVDSNSPYLVGQVLIPLPQEPQPPIIDPVVDQQTQEGMMMSDQGWGDYGPQESYQQPTTITTRGEPEREGSQDEDDSSSISFIQPYESEGQDEYDPPLPTIQEEPEEEESQVGPTVPELESTDDHEFSEVEDSQLDWTTTEVSSQETDSEDYQGSEEESDLVESEDDQESLEEEESQLESHDDQESQHDPEDVQEPEEDGAQLNTTVEAWSMEELDEEVDSVEPQDEDDQGPPTPPTTPPMSMVPWAKPLDVVDLDGDRGSKVQWARPRGRVFGGLNGDRGSKVPWVKPRGTRAFGGLDGDRSSMVPGDKENTPTSSGSYWNTKEEYSYYMDKVEKIKSQVDTCTRCTSKKEETRKTNPQPQPRMRSRTKGYQKQRGSSFRHPTPPTPKRKASPEPPEESVVEVKDVPTPTVPESPKDPQEPIPSTSGTRVVSHDRPADLWGCNLCRSNGETKKVYQSHNLRDTTGKVTCPVLRSLVCPICKATGDNAHTIRYCPRNREGNNNFPRLYQECRNSFGKRKTLKY